MKALMSFSSGRRVGWLLPVLLLAASSGCSDLSATVSGRVYLDGEPLKIDSRQRGMIVLRPVAGGATCTGLVGSEGEYEIATGGSAALVPGDYLVSVRVIEIIDPVIEGGAPGGKAITPAVYADPLTSNLSVLVARGANQYDIKLESSAGPAVLPVAQPAEEEDEPAEEENEAAAENESAADNLTGNELPANQEESGDEIQ